MDREASNKADTDSELDTHATGSSASADEVTTQPIAGMQESDLQEAGRQAAERDEATLQKAGPRGDGAAEAGATDAGGPETGGPETELKEAGPHEARRPESALAVIQDGTTAGLTTRTPATRAPATRTPATPTPATPTPATPTPATPTPATPTPATRAPAKRTAASLTPARRTPARAGDKNLARTPKKEPAGAARRTQTSRWAQPPRRLVPVFRPTFPGLATDPRLPIWIARVLTATAVGVAVSIWQNWRLGLTAAAAVAILDIIYRSRTTSVIPADVRVTSAQRRTRRRLALLRGRGYVALNARGIPGSDSVIDHLVIGPPGVFALDSERWDRRLPVRTAASGRLYHGPFGQEERLEHAVWEAAQASSLLGASLGRPISVRPAMVIYGPTIPWTVASLREVDVLAGRRLRKYFRRQARAAAGPRLDADQISQIHAAAAKALPPARGPRGEPLAHPAYRG
jgi:hypothetical protein